MLNTTCKVFSKILYLRLLPYAEKAIGSYQCGFQQGRSTVDQIYTLRQILEKTTEHNIETHHLFIDFITAYGNINRAWLYVAKQEFQFTDK
jgi:sorting nexin-29